MEFHTIVCSFCIIVHDNSIFILSSLALLGCFPISGVTNTTVIKFFHMSVEGGMCLVG